MNWKEEEKKKNCVSFWMQQQPPILLLTRDIMEYILLVNALRIRCVLRLTERSCYICIFTPFHNIKPRTFRSGPSSMCFWWSFRHRVDDVIVTLSSLSLVLMYAFIFILFFHMLFFFECFLGLYPIFGLFKGAYWNYRLVMFNWKRFLYFPFSYTN